MSKLFKLVCLLIYFLDSLGPSIRFCMYIYDTAGNITSFVNMGLSSILLIGNGTADHIITDLPLVAVLFIDGQVISMVYGIPPGL